MKTNKVLFVKKSLVFMCQFELCWDNDCSDISSKKEIISNIKPEIGKVRPVVVIYSHKRAKLALVVPFTTRKPTVEIHNTLEIPVGFMPGVLSKKKCWALCDMVCVVCTDRLQTIYSGKKDTYYRYLRPIESGLDTEYFEKIKTKLKKLIG